MAEIDSNDFEDTFEGRPDTGPIDTTGGFEDTFEGQPVVGYEIPTSSDLSVSIYDTVSVAEAVSGIISAVICSIYDEVTIEESVTIQVEVVVGGIEISVYDAVETDEQTIGFLENYCISVSDDVGVAESVSLAVSVADRSISVFDTVNPFEHYCLRLDVVAWTREDAFVAWGSSISARRTVIPNADLYWPTWNIGQISAAVWADPLGGYNLWGASAGSRHANADYSGSSFVRLYWEEDDSPNVPANTPALWSDWAINTGIDTSEDFMFHGYSFGGYSIDTYAGGTVYGVETGADKVVQTTGNISSTTADKTAHISGVAFATATVCYQYGGYYDLSINNTVTVSEYVAVVIPKLVSINDTTSVSESVSVSILAGGLVPVEVEIYEECAVGDEPVVAVGGCLVSVSDSTSIAESCTILLEVYVSVSDEISVDELAGIEIGAVEISVYDEITLSEDVTSQVSDPGAATQDSIGVAEDSTIIVSAPVATVYDEVTVEEGVELVLSSEISVYDAVSIDEALEVAPELVISVYDVVGLSESVSGSLSDLEVVVNDVAGIGDQVSGLGFDGYVSVYDEVTIVEELVLLTEFYVSVNDSISVIDAAPALVLSDLAPVVRENVRVREYANTFWLIATGIAIIDCDMVIALVGCELMVPEAHVNMQLPTLETEGV